MFEFLLAVTSFYGFRFDIEITFDLLSSIEKYHIQRITASYTIYGEFFEGLSGYLSFLFCVSKIAELGDTIILVLRKKPLIFLHWYHHVLTLNYGVLSLSEKTPYNTWITWLNFTVHAIMYR